MFLEYYIKTIFEIIFSGGAAKVQPVAVGGGDRDNPAWHGRGNDQLPDLGRAFEDLVPGILRDGGKLLHAQSGW